MDNSKRMGSSRSVIVIPARLESTRLPRKLLLRETGKSVLQHTYEAAQLARRPSSICVAADDEAIVREVRAFGGEAALTSRDCASGTDRVAELAATMDNVDIVVNVQADEPEISGEAIDQVVELLERDPTAVMSTVAAPIRTRQQLEDPACVKVVFDGAGGGAAEVAGRSSGRALYFSRTAIPHVAAGDAALDERLAADPPLFHQHIGLYAYRREFLLRLARLPRSPLEQAENLEQLRVLEAGETILVASINEATCGIDTPEDYRAFVARRMAG